MIILATKMLLPLTAIISRIVKAYYIADVFITSNVFSSQTITEHKYLPSAAADYLELAVLFHLQLWLRKSQLEYYWPSHYPSSLSLVECQTLS